MKKYISKITVHLDIFVSENEDDFDGESVKCNKVLIHGDPEGLKSFGRLLLKLAEINQNDLVELPLEAREHRHLRPKWDLSNSSVEVIVGRLDAKGTGEFYSRYVPKEISSDPLT